MIFCKCLMWDLKCYEHGCVWFFKDQEQGFHVYSRFFWPPAQGVLLVLMVLPVQFQYLSFHITLSAASQNFPVCVLYLFFLLHGLMLQAQVLAWSCHVFFPGTCHFLDPELISPIPPPTVPRCHIPSQSVHGTTNRFTYRFVKGPGP